MASNGGSFSVYESVVAFAKKVMTLPYVCCKTAIFNDPEKKVYTLNAKTTRIREVKSGGAVDYTGKYAVGESTDEVVWKDYSATADRYKNICLDVIDEMATYESGMSPTFIEVAKDFINRIMSGEIDATSIASWYQSVPATNVLSSADYTAKNTFEILDEISKKQLNAGIDLGVEVIDFVNTDRFFAMRQTIMDKNGLANSAILTTRSSDIEFGGDLGGVQINNDCIKYNNHTIIAMPADRMKSAVVLYDGVTGGQEAGGWAPANDADDVEILSMPINSGFMDVKYFVSNFFVPRIALGLSGNVATDPVMDKLLGDVIIKNADINQKADAFEADFRVIYNAELFNNQKNTVFALKK